MARPISRYIHHLATALLPGLSLADSVSWLDLLCTVGQQDADVADKLVSRCKELVCKDIDGKKEVQALAGMLTSKSDGPTGRAPPGCHQATGGHPACHRRPGPRGRPLQVQLLWKSLQDYAGKESELRLRHNLPRMSPVTHHKARVETQRLCLLGMQTSTYRA